MVKGGSKGQKCRVRNGSSRGLEGSYRARKKQQRKLKEKQWGAFIVARPEREASETRIKLETKRSAGDGSHVKLQSRNKIISHFE